jgi:ketopantoate hydroxymethyltransferase
VRRFADARATMSGGLSEYCAAVRSRAFPQDTESYHAPKSAAPVDTLAAEVREC